MDVIQLSGYTEDEKVEIAKRYLLPKQLEANGLKLEQIEVGDDVLRNVIREYTREAGLRSLERRIGDLMRKAATKVARGEAEHVAIDEATVRESLGPRRFSGDVRRRTADPGVATGLAVTSVGGDVLFIEATAYPGKGVSRSPPARRGDAGVRASRALVGSQPRRRARDRAGLVRSTTSTSTCLPAPCPRTVPLPGSRWRPRSSRWSRAAPCPTRSG